MGVHALYTAATGMDAQLRNIDVIANNVANINTEGYRRDRINFADLFYRKHALAGAGSQPRPSGIHIGHGVEVVSTEKIFRFSSWRKAFRVRVPFNKESKSVC